MSGYIGGILILSGCFMYGLSYSQRLKNRIIILKDMVRMLSVMNNHIGYSLIDLNALEILTCVHMSGISPDTYMKH